MQDSAQNAYGNTRLGVWWVRFAALLVLLFVAIGAPFVQRALAAEVTMEVYQVADGKVFGQKTSLDVFNHPRLGGKKLLAPYSKGIYSFAVYNNSKSRALPYSLDIEVDNPEGIPLVASLRKNGQYIFAGAAPGGLLPLSTFSIPEAPLAGENTDLYTLEWEWRTESDEKDTEIGNDGSQEYTLTITATGTMEEEDISPKPARPVKIDKNTGDSARILVWLVLAIMGALLLIIVLRRHRKRDEDEAKKPLPYLRYVSYGVIVMTMVSGVALARFATSSGGADGARVAELDVVVTHGGTWSGGYYADVSSHVAGGNQVYSFTVLNQSEVPVRAQVRADKMGTSGANPQISPASFDLAPLGGSQAFTVTVTGTADGNKIKIYVDYTQID